MRISLASVVNKRSHAFTVTRQFSGTYVNGRYVESTPETFASKGSVQTVSGKERLLLPEGIRDREVLKIYTTDVLYTADALNQKLADKITVNGSEYEVVIVETWALDGAYYKIIAMRVGQ